MRLSRIAELIDANPVDPECDLSLEITCGGAADLMSDVLAFTRPGAVLLTGLTNTQVIRTSDVAGVAAIVFVRGKVPPPETRRLAKETGIPLLRTSLTMFDACGRLYEAGLRYSGTGAASR